MRFTRFAGSVCAALSFLGCSGADDPYPLAVTGLVPVGDAGASGDDGRLTIAPSSTGYAGEESGADAGGPCIDGTSRSCLVIRDADLEQIYGYQYCEEGVSSCSGGQWGPCELDVSPGKVR